MATANRMCYTQDWTCLLSDEFSTEDMEIQLSQYQHIRAPVPIIGNVCPAVWCKNMDSLGCRRSDTGGFPREVSATDTWCMLVCSCLQCRGASAIWFVNHWWHLTSSTLVSVWPSYTSTSTWCSASDGGYPRRQKANGQLEKTAGSPSQRLAQQGSVECQRFTAIYAVEIWDRQESRSGATLHSDYTRRRRRRWWWWWWRM